jgi:hypothetical protein
MAGALVIRVSLAVEMRKRYARCVKQHVTQSVQIHISKPVSLL